MLLGAASACVCYYAVYLVKRVMGVDDALGRAGRAWRRRALGSLLLPLVALIGVAGGTLNHAPLRQFTVQAVGVAVVALFSGAATFVITRIADLLVGLRVDREHETVGLDYATHGETGYHIGR